MARFFHWFLLVALGCMGGLGIGRVVMLYVRGVPVVAVDWQRSAMQMAADTVLFVLGLLWLYETVACSWPLPFHLVPAWLGAAVFDAVAARALGAGMLVVAVGLYGAALWSFGESWRLGIDRKTPGPLVTGGIFAWTRNPVYLALDLFAVGTVLIQGRVVFVVLAPVLIGLLHGQIRREERFLAEQFGQAYRDYCARVGRYVTWPWARQRAGGHGEGE